MHRMNAASNSASRPLRGPQPFGKCGNPSLRASRRTGTGPSILLISTPATWEGKMKRRSISLSRQSMPAPPPGVGSPAARAWAPARHHPSNTLREKVKKGTRNSGVLLCLGNAHDEAVPVRRAHVGASYLRFRLHAVTEWKQIRKQSRQVRYPSLCANRRSGTGAPLLFDCAPVIRGETE